MPARTLARPPGRDRKRRGEPVWYLVPDGVVQYIAKHHLYTSTRYHSWQPHPLL